MPKPKVVQCRKNGGFMWHWVRAEGPSKGEALCGAVTNRRQKKSYWVQHGNLATCLSGRWCPKCDKLGGKYGTD